VDQSLRSRAWLVELRRVALILLLGLVGGLLFEAPRSGVALALVLALAFHLRLLYLLWQWTQDNGKKLSLPDPGGVWGEVFDALYAQQRRNRKRKRKLASIVSEFQASTAALPDGAIVVSPKGTIAWFNASAQALLGLRAPQDIGNRIVNLIRSPAFMRYMEGDSFDGDIDVASPLNPQFTLSLRLIPYGDGQRLLIIRDVSEHKRLDLMRRDFVANASHELRTPLTVLSGYIEMMMPDAASDDAPLAPWRAPLKEMHDQLSRMELLITDLLKLARLESETVAPRQLTVDMPDVISTCLRQAEQLSQQQHRIRAEVDESLGLAGRESELRSVVMNLLSNAVRYTPEGGEIHLRWCRTNRGEGALCVRDTGIGIEESLIPRLTERFYRVDVGRSRASGGTGR